MNLGTVEQIAKAVLYEGYMLYPYRPSSVKNQQRFNFGVLYPESYAQAQGGVEPSMMRAECLVEGDTKTIASVKLRFLQLRARTRTQADPADGNAAAAWQEAMEKEVGVRECCLAELCKQTQQTDFFFESAMEVAMDFTRRRAAVRGNVNVSAQELGDSTYKLRIEVSNATSLAAPNIGRDEVLMRSLVSAHLVLGVSDGNFVSLLEPPRDRQQLAEQCQNAGWWPILVGEPGQRDTMLVSPIILYDYPQIAKESAGDLFDGTEIDEILSLRIMTLTEEEKKEIRASDERARLILERTDAMPPEQFMKLHGVVRGLRPLKEESL